ncbi:hypothetical protein IAU59_007099 [Kwoniella sp. CBS 9459]
MSNSGNSSSSTSRPPNVKIWNRDGSYYSPEPISEKELETRLTENPEQFARDERRVEERTEIQASLAAQQSAQSTTAGADGTDAASGADTSATAATATGGTETGYQEA